jgi:hypothetical protein
VRLSTVANEKVQELERRIEALQTALTDAETRVEDQKAEHAVCVNGVWLPPPSAPVIDRALQIATRMLKQMNKELKSQLAKGLSARVYPGHCPSVLLFP